MLIQDFYVEISKQPSAGVACTSIEKKLWHRWFPVGFTKILITSFLYNTSGRLFQDRQLANRFRRMCGSLYSREYWEVFFLRTLPANAPSLNQRVFHQQEVELTGFTAEQVETVVIACSENTLWIKTVDEFSGNNIITYGWDFLSRLIHWYFDFLLTESNLLQYFLNNWWKYWYDSKELYFWWFYEVFSDF